MKHAKKAIGSFLGFALALTLSPALMTGTALTAHAQEGYWQPDEPPGQWSGAWHSGFHDGIEAARHDIDAHRPPDPDRHDTFRHPDRPREQRHDFREGFRRGYQMVYDHDWHHRDHDRDDHPGL